MHKNNQILNGKKSIKSINQTQGYIHIQIYKEIMHKTNKTIFPNSICISINSINSIYIFKIKEIMHKTNKTIFTIIYAFQSIQSIQYTYSFSQNIYFHFPKIFIFIFQKYLFSFSKNIYFHFLKIFIFIFQKYIFSFSKFNQF